MAQGTADLFDEFWDQIGKKIHNFQTGGDVFKVAMITDAVVATAGDTTPVLGDYTEVSGTGYSAGGETVANQDWSYAAREAWFIGDDISWAQNGAGPTDCFQAIVYNSDEGDKAVAFLDLTDDGGTTPLSLQDGPIVVAWGGGKIFKAE